MRKFYCLLIGILILSCGCSKSHSTAGYASDRHYYDEETRMEQNTDVPVSDMLTMITIPEGESFRYMTISSDVILAGTVADEGVTERMPIFEVIPDSPETDVTTYQIDVREVIEGSCDEEQITLKLYWDYQTRPYKNDELILFLNKQGDIYTPVTADNDSIFVINPPNDKIFAFSGSEDMIQFDNSSVEDFRSFINDEICSFREDPSDYKGIVGDIVR